eukprot:488068_1
MEGRDTIRKYDGIWPSNRPDGYISFLNYYDGPEGNMSDSWSDCLSLHETVHTKQVLSLIRDVASPSLTGASGGSETNDALAITTKASIAKPEKSIIRHAASPSLTGASGGSETNDALAITAKVTDDKISIDIENSVKKGTALETPLGTATNARLRPAKNTSCIFGFVILLGLVAFYSTETGNSHVVQHQPTVFHDDELHGSEHRGNNHLVQHQPTVFHDDELHVSEHRVMSTYCDVGTLWAIIGTCATFVVGITAYFVKRNW